MMRPGCESYVYAVRVGDRYLLHAPVCNLAALVNGAAVREIRAFLATGQIGPEVPTGLAAMLKAMGAVEAGDPVKRRGPLAPAFLGMIPSRRCNMACRYCGFRDPVSPCRTMDPATAVAAIDFMSGYCQRRGSKAYQVQFFGGEPFVEDRIVDVVVHHALSLASSTGIVPSFVASTNGLTSPTRRRFVADYFDTVVLSLDGFPEFHDRYRPAPEDRATFDQVVETARYLMTSQTRLCIRCCVTGDSVHHMEAMARWFCEELRPAIVNFEPMTESPASQAAGLSPPRPHDFARHAFRAWNVLRSYGCEPASASVLTQGLQSSSCPVGRDAVIVHPDGLLASCYLLPSEWHARGLDLSIGRVQPDGVVDVRMKDVLALRRLGSSKPRCVPCFCFLTCAGGCHVNNSYPGCPEEYGDFCLATRSLTACTLLEELGQADLADEIVSDPEMLDALSVSASDRVVDLPEVQ